MASRRRVAPPARARPPTSTAASANPRGRLSSSHDPSEQRNINLDEGRTEAKVWTMRDDARKRGKRGLSAAPTRLGTPRRARARPARVVEPRGRLEPRESRSRARPARDEGADDHARAVDAIGRLRAGETGSTMDGTPTRGDGTMRRERDGAMARDASTPTRAMDRAKGGVGEKRRAAAMLSLIHI